MIKEYLIDLADYSSIHCVGTEGNVSCRGENDNMWIKASGASLHNLQIDDIVEVRFNRTTPTIKPPSMEYGFHMWLYKKFPEINCISHTHPTKTVGILCSHHSYDFAYRRLFPDQVVFNGAKSCLISYAQPGKELEKSIEKGVNAFVDVNGYSPNLILLQNHGIITLGTTIEKCIIANDICEKAANIFITAKMIDGVHFLAKTEIESIINDEDEKYRLNLVQ